MTSRNIFGWSYPPGAATDPLAPYNQQEPDPSPESNKVADILDRISRPDTGRQQDRIVAVVDNLAQERDELISLLTAALPHLPQRGPEPPCTCGQADPNEFGWCEQHDGYWHEPTLFEEIEASLKRFNQRQETRDEECDRED